MLKEMLNHATLEELKLYLSDIHAHDLAELFVELSETEKQKIFDCLEVEKLAELVSYIDTEDAADILSEFELDEQKEIVELMEPDDAADIILELEKDEQQELLKVLGDDSDIAQLIEYEEDETGSAMTNAMIVIHPDMDVKKATKKVIKEANDVETINTIFVVDEKEMYLGVVPLKKLLKAKTPLAVSEIVEDYPVVFDTDPITQSIQAIRNYGIYEIPVLDHESHQLLGMLTLDDALDIYQEEAQEDFEKLAGLPETMPDSSPLKTALHRLPWLLSLLLFSIPIAIVTSMFEEVLATVAILIVFQPLILGSAGNVATQTLAVTLKMFASHETGIFKNSIREIITGMLNGFAIGLIAFSMTLIFSIINTSLTTQPFLIAFVVGLSLWLTVIIAPLTAILIPVSLRAMKFDPAVASGPFITTIIDVAALLIYFGLATLMLGGI
jgi:magnesium transporter